MIPIYTPDGKILRHESVENVEAFAQHYDIVRNRRGRIKRAALKASLGFDCRHMSKQGMAFRQPLSGGFAWALRGVRGSGAV